MSYENELDFQNATECWICKEEFIFDQEITQGEFKVRDHDHFNGKYRGAAHSRCNLKARSQKTIPIFFHNFSGYDCHIMIKDLMAYRNDNQQIKVIGKTMEEYIGTSIWMYSFYGFIKIITIFIRFNNKRYER